MQNIKAIIFDLGGVLLNIDYKKVSDAFKELQVYNFDELYSQSDADLLFENLETGKIDDEEFYTHLKKYTSKAVTKKDVIQAWNSILIDFRKESLDYLSILKNKYRLFLLSNTNIIHFAAFNKIFDVTIGKNSFNSFFEKAYYSHEMGLRKPNPESYLYVLNENNLRPESTLFIDDTLKNVEGARAVGMPAVLLEKGMKIEDLGL